METRHRRFFLNTLLACGGAFLTIRAARGETSDAPKDSPRLRIICATNMPDEREFVLASRDEKGGWIKHSTVMLRSSFISQWQPVITGKLHLASQVDGNLVPVSAFTLPADSRRAIVVLLPDTRPDRFRADLIDPDKLHFREGSTLVINYSSMNGVVFLGTSRSDLQPGGRSVSRPAVGNGGMFRLLVGYKDSGGEITACHDRYIPAGEKCRDFLLLLPDANLGLRVFSLPEFGPFE